MPLPIEEKPAVVVGFDGGLGNQMFQYAAARALALRSGCELLLDTSHYRPGSDRRYLLDRFAIAGRPLGILERHRFGLERFAPGGGRRSEPPRGIRLMRENAINRYRPLPPKIRRPLYLDGSWQHFFYFAGEAAAIRTELQLRQSSPGLRAARGAIEAVEAVAVHVRRTDFFSGMSRHFGVCSIDYFVRAIALVRERLPDAVFHVFSDDIAWTSRNLPVDGPHMFMPANVDDPVEDFALMASCRHFIISNSTFSWWAAWLGTFPGKIVVNPAQWFTIDADWNPSPPEWIRLPP